MDLELRNETYHQVLVRGRVLRRVRWPPPSAEARRRCATGGSSCTRPRPLPWTHRPRGSDGEPFAAVPGRIETSCADCGEPLAVDVRNAQPDGKSLLFHCLVPAAR